MGNLRGLFIALRRFLPLANIALMHGPVERKFRRFALGTELPSFNMSADIAEIVQMGLFSSMIDSKIFTLTLSLLAANDQKNHYRRLLYDLRVCIKI